MTASISVFTNPFNEKSRHNAIFTIYKENELDPNETCIMPYIYDFRDNMTAMTNGNSGTPGAPLIETSKSPTKNDKNINNNINQHPHNSQGVYREKESNQHTARGMYINTIT